MKIAVFDLSLTLIGGFIIGKKLKINPWLFSMSMIPLGILTHKMLGIETEISKKMNQL